MKIVTDEEIRQLCANRGMTKMSEGEAFNLVVVYNNDEDTDYSYRAIDTGNGWVVAVYNNDEEYVGAL